jgi:hypothetical protein
MKSSKKKLILQWTYYEDCLLCTFLSNEQPQKQQSVVDKIPVRIAHVIPPAIWQPQGPWRA